MHTVRVRTAGEKYETDRSMNGDTQKRTGILSTRAGKVRVGAEDPPATAAPVAAPSASSVLSRAGVQKKVAPAETVGT